jgi:hypothetical protein
MSHRLQILVPEQLDSRIAKAARRKRVSMGAWVRLVVEKALVEEAEGEDPLVRLASLGAPTGDIDQMLTEIEAGRR